MLHYSKIIQGWRSLIYLRRMCRFYAQFIKHGDLVFDVGANLGSRTRVFLELGARVVAVEPQEECALTLFLSFYNDPNFQLVNKALAAADGEGEMLIANFSQVSTLSYSWSEAIKQHSAYAKIAWNEKRKVSMTTLDALVKISGQPSFVKIDAEGFEYEILRGLSRALPALSFEFNPVYLKPALQSIEYLQRFGTMHLNYCIEERFDWMLDHWVTPADMMPILKAYENGADFIYGDVYVRFDHIFQIPNTRR